MHRVDEPRRPRRCRPGRWTTGSPATTPRASPPAGSRAARCCCGSTTTTPARCPRSRPARDAVTRARRPRAHGDGRAPPLRPRRGRRLVLQRDAARWPAPSRSPPASAPPAPHLAQAAGLRGPRRRLRAPPRCRAWCWAAYPARTPRDDLASLGPRAAAAGVRGLVVGRALLYPPGGDVAAAVTRQRGRSCREHAGAVGVTRPTTPGSTLTLPVAGGPGVDHARDAGWTDAGCGSCALAPGVPRDRETGDRGVRAAARRRRCGSTRATARRGTSSPAGVRCSPRSPTSSTPAATAR